MIMIIGKSNSYGPHPMPIINEIKAASINYNKEWILLNLPYNVNYAQVLSMIAAYCDDIFLYKSLSHTSDKLLGDNIMLSLLK